MIGCGEGELDPLSSTRLTSDTAIPSAVMSGEPDMPGSFAACVNSIVRLLVAKGDGTNEPLCQVLCSVSAYTSPGSGSRSSVKVGRIDIAHVTPALATRRPYFLRPSDFRYLSVRAFLGH
jgi:hypothetical protein